jgi:hypothetical protein
MWKFTVALTLFLVLSFSTNSYGQIKPEILPEDFNTGDQGIVCLCRPGVRNKSRSKGLALSYGFLGEGTFEEEETPLTSSLSQYGRLDHFNFDLKIPIILKDEIAILLGYTFFAERFKFDRIGDDFRETFEQLDNDFLKSNSLSLIISKPLNEKNYIAGRLRYTANGNYDQFFSFENKYAIYKAIAVYGIKPNEDFEWGVGISYSKSFRNQNFIPFLLFNKTFTDSWGIEAILPGYINLRHNVSRTFIVLGGIEFASQSYRIDTEPNAFDQVFAYAYNHTELIASTSIEYGIAPWVWANLKLGYQFNFSSDFDSKNLRAAPFDADPSSAIFFNIGVFISPPDNDRQG